MSTIQQQTTDDIYNNCVTAIGSNGQPPTAEGLLHCLTENLHLAIKETQQAIERDRINSRNFHLLNAAALVFFMQAGFAMLCAGAVRRKNLQNTMLKNLLDACGAAIAFYAVGYAFAFGDKNESHNFFIGTTNFFLIDYDDFAFFLFQYAFSATAATIIAGTLAERCQMGAYFYYSMFLTGFVYPIVVHACWSPYGIISPTNSNSLFGGVGMIDIAGGGVVHVTGGATALVATLILGPRRGRFHDVTTGVPLRHPKPIQGHNIGFQLLGVLILWFGWYGFNAGSAMILGSGLDDSLAALAAANTTLSAGVAGVTTLYLNYVIVSHTKGEAKYDLQLTMNGILAGLVAITAGCCVVETWGAVLIGFVAGALYLIGHWSLIHFRIDDAVDAIPVHFINGIWGVLAVGLFATADRIEQSFGNYLMDDDEKRRHVVGFFTGIFDPISSTFNLTLLGAQLIGIISILAWTTFIMTPFFTILDWQGAFRSSAEDEIKGLDVSFHGGTARAGGSSDDEGDAVAQIANLDKTSLDLLTKRLEEANATKRRRSSSIDNESTMNDLEAAEGPKKNVVG